MTAIDILGPASALNSVTTRPAQSTTYGATRTWFKNCTSLTTQDGTELTNDWLNNILAQLRTAFDSTGIVEDNGDDMLYRAMQTIGIRFGTDTGSVNALAVDFAVPVTAYTAGLTLEVVTAHAPTGATTINCNGLGTKTIVKGAATALQGGEWQAGQAILLIYDGTNFEINAVSGYSSPTGPYSDISTFVASGGSASIPYATHTAVPFGSATIGSQNNVELASGAIQCLVAGTYVISFSSDAYSSDGTDPLVGLSVWLHHNGSVIYPSGNGMQSTGGSPFIKENYGGGSFVLTLAAGDTIQLGVYQVNGGTATYNIGYSANLVITRVR